MLVADDHEHEDADKPSVDASVWFHQAPRLSCPACGAAGAVALGGGLFCPACGEVTKNPGFQAPAG